MIVKLAKDLEAPDGKWCIVLYSWCAYVKLVDIKKLKEHLEDIDDFLEKKDDREAIQLIIWIRHVSSRKKITPRAVYSLGRLNMRGEDNIRKVQEIADIDVPDELISEVLDKAMQKDITADRLKRKFKLNFGSARNYLRLRWFEKYGLDFREYRKGDGE